MADPDMTAARVSDEARARDMLGGVARRIPDSETIVGDADHQGLRADVLQIVAWQRQRYPRVVHYPLPPLAHRQRVLEQLRGARPLLRARLLEHLGRRGEDRAHHGVMREPDPRPVDEVRPKSGVEQEL